MEPRNGGEKRMESKQAKRLGEEKMKAEGKLGNVSPEISVSRAAFKHLRAFHSPVSIQKLAEGKANKTEGETSAMNA